MPWRSDSSDATTFNWSGLPAGNRYLGRILYGDGASTFATPTTQIEVSTPLGRSR
jgi:hypothetical protein